MIILVVACENHPTSAPAPAVSATPSLTRIEDLPKLAAYRDPKSPYDCTITSALQAFAPGARVVACGLLERDAPAAAVEAQGACATRAVAASQPVVFGRAIQGTDSGIAEVAFARDERGRYTGYVARFDSDPCGGSCGDRGGTRIVRCTGAPQLDHDCIEVGVCLTCDGEYVETCRHGRPSPMTRVDAERARTQVIGATPASLGPAFGPLQLGAPFAEWTAPAVQAAIGAIAAGGIVWIDHDRRPHGATIDSVVIQFAGPCRAVHDMIAARWGASADRRWLDPAAHRRAHLDVVECELRIERYLDVHGWLDDTALAPFPLGAIGSPAARLAARVGSVVEDESIRWWVPGIGRATGLVEINALVTRGRVTALDARGQADPATIEQLRLRLSELRGAPIRNEGPDRQQIWRGKPHVHLDVDSEGFRISVSEWTHDPP